MVNLAFPSLTALSEKRKGEKGSFYAIYLIQCHVDKAKLAVQHLKWKPIKGPTL